MRLRQAGFKIVGVPFSSEEERRFFPVWCFVHSIMLRHPHRVACVADRISSRNKLKFFCSKPAAPRSAMTPCHSCATCQESKRRGSEHLVPSQEEELLSWCCKGRRLACEGRRWCDLEGS